MDCNSFLFDDSGPQQHTFWDLLSAVKEIPTTARNLLPFLNNKSKINPCYVFCTQYILRVPLKYTSLYIYLPGLFLLLERQNCRDINIVTRIYMKF